MHGSQVIIELLIILGTAAVATLLFSAVRLPPVLGYVAAGIIVGPHVPVPLVANAALVHTLAELGVIMLMFAIGLELRLSKLAQVGASAALTAIFEIGLVVLCGTVIGRLLGFSGNESLFLACALAISSTMVVAKTFERLGLRGGFTDTVFAILVFEDLIAIVLLTVLSGLAAGAGLGPGDMALTVAKLTGFVLVVLLAGLLVVPRLVRLLSRHRLHEPLLVVALTVCFAGAALSQCAGYSVALGAFVAGLVIAESGHGHDITEMIRPFRDIFAVTFFVSVGMMVEPASLVESWPAILIFSAFVLVAKPLAITLGGFFSGRGLETSMRAGVSLAQTGEFAFVIATIGASSSPRGKELLAIAVGVTCITTLSSGFTIPRSHTIACAVNQRLPGPIATFVSFYDGWLARLGARRASAWSHVRRRVLVLVVDVALVIAIAVGATFVPVVLRSEWGLGAMTATVITVLAAAIVSIPFVRGTIKTIIDIANQLGSEVIPLSRSTMDLGRAPRRALVTALETALGGLVIMAIVTALHVFIGAFALVAVVSLLIVGGVTLRAITDFDQHVRAGSQLILELLHQPAPTAPETLAQVDAALPGFADTSAVVLHMTSPAVGQSLASLNVRAETGATVLAIARGEGGFASPSPQEALVAGDILAITGPAEAISLARALLLGAAADVAIASSATSLTPPAE